MRFASDLQRNPPALNSAARAGSQCHPAQPQESTVAPTPNGYTGTDVSGDAMVAATRTMPDEAQRDAGDGRYCPGDPRTARQAETDGAVRLAENILRDVVKNMTVSTSLPLVLLATSVLCFGCVSVDDKPQPQLEPSDYTLAEDRRPVAWNTGYSYRFGADKLKAQGGLSVLAELRYVAGRVVGHVLDDGTVLAYDFGTNPAFGFPPVFFEWRTYPKRSALAQRLDELFRDGVRQGEYVDNSLIYSRTDDVVTAALCTLYFWLPESPTRYAEQAEVHIVVARFEHKTEPDYEPTDERWDGWPPGMLCDIGDSHFSFPPEYRLFIFCDASVNHMLLFPADVSFEFLRTYMDLTKFHADFERWVLREIDE